MAFQDYTANARTRLHVGQVGTKGLVGIAAVGVMLIGMLAWGAFSLAGQQDDLLVKAEEESVSHEAQDRSAEEVPAALIVHVGGCVTVPGVYQLDQGARVSDAVESAGGLAADAAADRINLARAVEDGEQIIVPSIHEETAAPASDMQAGSEGAASSSTSAGKVNINTASSDELQTLSGIGESKAKKIIACREQNGPFKSVDDLLNVSGIGEKTLEALRDSICV